MAAFFCAMKKSKGIFITFEGIDGCGKSTQAVRLYRYLKQAGYPVLFLREPGGNAVSEKIRRLILDPRLTITPLAELFLYEAARAQVTTEVIAPALKKNQIVVCDRFFDSTTAYQGFGRGLDRRLISRLNNLAANNIAPDLTFVFDVDYQTSLKRRGKNPDRLEREKKAFFNRVRRGFKELASQRRVQLLDGRHSIEDLFGVVQKTVLALIKRRY